MHGVRGWFLRSSNVLFSSAYERALVMNSTWSVKHLHKGLPTALGHKASGVVVRDTGDGKEHLTNLGSFNVVSPCASMLPPSQVSSWSHLFCCAVFGFPPRWFGRDFGSPAVSHVVRFSACLTAPRPRPACVSPLTCLKTFKKRRVPAGSAKLFFNTAKGMEKAIEKGDGMALPAMNSARSISVRQVGGGGGRVAGR